MKANPKLQKIFERAKGISQDIFRANGEVLPMWHAVTKKGENLLIPTSWASDEEKDITLDILRELFAAKKVVRFVFVCEAWSVRLDTKISPARALCTRPTDHPDRREVVRIMAEDRDGSTLGGMYFILRPEPEIGGPPTLSSFHEDPPDQTMKGRMTHMLGGG